MLRVPMIRAYLSLQDIQLGVQPYQLLFRKGQARFMLSSIVKPQTQGCSSQKAPLL